MLLLTSIKPSSILVAFLLMLGSAVLVRAQSLAPSTATSVDTSRDQVEAPAKISPNRTGKSKSTNSKLPNSKFPNAKSANAKSANAKSANAKFLPGITPEREAAVMTFVAQHHPELAELLIHLKENVPKEYDRAVRDLFRTSERLAQVQERDHQAYELELNLWQARSRAQLLGARLQMADSEELRQQLRSTLNEEYDARLQLLQRDRERAADRVRGLDDQISKVRDRRADEIEKQLKQWTSARRGNDVQVKAAAKKKTTK